MKRLLAFSLIVALAASTAAAQDGAQDAAQNAGAGVRVAPVDPVEFASLVPPETLAIVQWDDRGGYDRWSRETALGRMWTDPEMQAFLTKLDRAVIGAMRRAGGGADPLSMLGLTVEDLRAVEMRDGGLALVDLRGELGEVDLVMTARFRGGAEEAAKIVAAARSGLETFLGLVFEDVEIRGRALQRIRPAPGFEIVFGCHEARFWMATSARRLERTLAALDGERGASLATQGRFRVAKARMKAGEAVMLAYADVPRLSSKLMSIARAEGASARDLTEFRRIWATLGFDSLEALAMADVPSGDGFRTEFALTMRDRSGALALAQPGLLTDRFAGLARSDALLFGTERWDWAEGWERVRQLIRTLDPRADRELEQGLAEMRGALGFDPIPEFLASIGEEYAWSLGPPPGGGAFPDLTLWLSLRDAARFEKTVLRLLDGMRPIAERERTRLRVRSTTFRGATIRFVEMSERDGDPIPLAPAWCLRGDHVVLGLWPQTIKHALTTDEALSGHPDFVALRGRLPETTVNYVWIDGRRLAGWVWNTAVPLLQLVQGGLNTELVPFDVRIPFEDLPVGDLIRRHLGGMVMYTAVERDAIRVGWISPYGVAGAALPMTVLAGAAGATVRRNEVARERMTRRAREAERRAAERTERRARQQELGAALAERTAALERERARREALEAELRSLEAQVEELRRLVEELERRER